MDDLTKQAIDVQLKQKECNDIELTTNHWGYFEVKLCPLNHHGKTATQECMDANPLPLADNPSENK